MKKNVGSIDKIVRIIIAIIAIYFARTGAFEATWVSYLLYAISGIALVTGVVGTCPLYAVFGIKTTK